MSWKIGEHLCQSGLDVPFAKGVHNSREVYGFSKKCFMCSIFKVSFLEKHTSRVSSHNQIKRMCTYASESEA